MEHKTDWWAERDREILREIVDEHEACVSCKKMTDIRKDLHIDFREHYVEGAGQLCKTCFDKIYKN